jgi:hypothetical protein
VFTHHNTATSFHPEQHKRFLLIGVIAGAVLMVIVAAAGVYSILPSSASAGRSVGITSDEVSGPQLEKTKTDADVKTVTNAFLRSQEAAQMLASASDRGELICQGFGNEDRFVGMGFRISSTGKLASLGFGPEHPSFGTVKSWISSPPCQRGEVFPGKLKFVRKRQSSVQDGLPAIGVANWIVVEQ